jgi:purine-binding chemotaxis protein CheW
MSEANLSPTQYLTFLLKGEVFAVDIRMVREIIPSGHMTKVPMMPPFIRGIINLRGAVVPVIDIQSRFGWERSVVNTKTCIVILDATGSSGQSPLGLMVDEVSEVIEIDPAFIDPPPNFGTIIAQDLILGMTKVQDVFIVILKPSHAFDMDVLTSMVGQDA